MATISVVTINLNNVEGLKKTFDSLSNQSSQDFEYIVIDGNSTDGSIELATEFSSIINILSCAKDSGISEAFNRGIALATGSYILMLNSGDQLYSFDIIERLISIVRSTDKQQILFGGVFNEQNKIPIDPFSITEKELIPHQGSLVPRSLYQKYGGYSVGFRIRMDLEFFLRLKTFGVVFSPIDLTVARYSADGVSARKESREVFYREGLAAYLLHYGRLKLKTVVKFIYWKCLSKISRMRS